MRCVTKSVIDYYNDRYNYLYQLQDDTLVYVIHNSVDEYYCVQHNVSDIVVLKSLEHDKTLTVSSSKTVEFNNGLFVLVV